MTTLGFLTFFHTAISFLAIALGIPAVAALFRAEPGGWRTPFIVAAVLVTGTGFLFPFTGVTPAFAVGIVAALILLAVVVTWPRPGAGLLARRIHAAGIVASLYLLVFVLIAQAFQKEPFLRSLAPTGTEAPFAISQMLALVGFVGLGIAAVRAIGAHRVAATQPRRRPVRG